VRVPDAGHMIPWDNAPGFYAAFGTFLGAPLEQHSLTAATL
jgi:N-formylmaleamate deformylase